MDLEQASPRVGVRSVALFLACAFTFFASLYVYAPILPIYTQQLGASLTMVGLVVGAYGAAMIVLRVPLGLWSDRIGRRRPFIAGGMLASALGALGLALAPTPWLLFLGRAVTGAGAANWVAFTVLLASYFPPERAVQAMSLASFTFGVGQVLANYAGGQIAQAFGWTAPFYVGAGLALLGFVGAQFLTERPAETRAERFSLRRAARVASRPLLLAVSVNALLTQCVVFATTYAFTPIYAERLGASRADQGLLVTAMVLPYTCSMLAASWLADRIGDRATVAGGTVVAAAAVLATVLAGSLPALAGVQVGNGIGLGLAYPVLMGLSIRAVPQQERATAMGFFQAIYAVGVFAGPPLAGCIADAFGLPAVFLAASAVCLLSAALALKTIPGRSLS